MISRRSKCCDCRHRLFLRRYIDAHRSDRGHFPARLGAGRAFGIPRFAARTVVARRTLRGRPCTRSFSARRGRSVATCCAKRSPRGTIVSVLVRDPSSCLRMCAGKSRSTRVISTSICHRMSSADTTFLSIARATSRRASGSSASWTASSRPWNPCPQASGPPAGSWQGPPCLISMLRAAAAWSYQR